MGKKKKKQVNPKKEKYAKFRKEKPAMTFTVSDITAEQQRQRQEDDKRISFFWRNNPRRPEPEVNKRKERSKR